MRPGSQDADAIVHHLPACIEPSYVSKYMFEHVFAPPTGKKRYVPEYSGVYMYVLSKSTGQFV